MTDAYTPDHHATDYRDSLLVPVRDEYANPIVGANSPPFHSAWRHYRRWELSEKQRAAVNEYIAHREAKTAAFLRATEAADAIVAEAKTMTADDWSAIFEALT